MGGDVEDQRRLVVAVEVAPVQRDHGLGRAVEHEERPFVLHLVGNEEGAVDEPFGRSEVQGRLHASRQQGALRREAAAVRASDTELPAEVHRRHRNTELIVRSRTKLIAIL